MEPLSVVDSLRFRDSPRPRGMRSTSAIFKKKFHTIKFNSLSLRVHYKLKMGVDVDTTKPGDGTHSY